MAHASTSTYSSADEPAAISSAHATEADLDALARKDEMQYVHEVYESIASHFSSTRYKPWPGITQFFESLPTGSLGLDAGCGNGKYLGLRSALHPAASRQDPSSAAVSKSSKGKQKADEIPEPTNLNSPLGPIITIGLDYSSNLVQIAKERSHEVLVGDAIDMPWREGTFDFAISIATIHHFTTASRRRQAVRTMMRALNKKHGKLFIQVWAVEQERPIVKTRSSTHTEGTDDKDQKPLLKRARDMDKLEKATSALQSLHLSETAKQEVFVPWKLQQRPSSKKIENDTSNTEVQEEKTAPVYQRYYHLFKAGELRELVMQAAAEELDESLLSQLKVDEEELWEQGNWCIQARFGA